jgi:hypothetical protein
MRDVKKLSWIELNSLTDPLMRPVETVHRFLTLSTQISLVQTPLCSFIFPYFRVTVENISQTGSLFEELF